MSIIVKYYNYYGDYTAKGVYLNVYQLLEQRLEQVAWYTSAYYNYKKTQATRVNIVL